MEFVGSGGMRWRENDKRHASKHSEQGQVRVGGDGVGGRGNVRLPSGSVLTPFGVPLEHPRSTRVTARVGTPNIYVCVGCRPCLSYER